MLLMQVNPYSSPGVLPRVFFLFLLFLAVIKASATTNNSNKLHLYCIAAFMSGGRSKALEMLGLHFVCLCVGEG